MEQNVVTALLDKIKQSLGTEIHCCTLNSSLHIGESFQDYSWFQDFEADFPQKVSLKILI